MTEVSLCRKIGTGEARYGGRAAVELKPSGEGGIVNHHISTEEVGTVLSWVHKRRWGDNRRCVSLRGDVENSERERCEGVESAEGQAKDVKERRIILKIPPAEATVRGNGRERGGADVEAANRCWRRKHRTYKIVLRNLHVYAEKNIFACFCDTTSY